jgi:hypothetical protein
MERVYHTTIAGAGLVLAMVVVRPATAQSSDCRESTNWEQCALAAAGFDHLPGGVVRQILVINGSGPPHVPYSGLLLRESADSVHGWSFLIWPAKEAAGSLADQRCEQRWQNEGGMLCLGRQDEQRDWRVVRDSLDRLGIAMIPLPPAPPTPSRTTGPPCSTSRSPLPPLPPALGESALSTRSAARSDRLVYADRLPVDCLRDVMADGMYLKLRVWTHGVTWQYTITDPGRDPTASQLRDQAIANLMNGLM